MYVKIYRLLCIIEQSKNVEILFISRIQPVIQPYKWDNVQLELKTHTCSTLWWGHLLWWHKPHTSANWVSMVMSSTGAEGDLRHTHTHTHHTHGRTLPARTRGPVKYKLVPLMCHKMPPKVINWSVIGGWHVIYMKIICIRQQSSFSSKSILQILYVEAYTYWGFFSFSSLSFSQWHSVHFWGL